MKDQKFKIILTILISILIVVCFYIFVVHIPYYQHNNRILNIRNKICETNKYEYDDYFYEYNGQKQYYILRVKTEVGHSYVAADGDANVVATYSSECYDVEIVKKDMIERFKLTENDVKDIDVVYENSIFCYYKKIQKGEQLLYVYYNIQTGEFVKSYDLRSSNE